MWVIWSRTKYLLRTSKDFRMDKEKIWKIQNNFSTHKKINSVESCERVDDLMYEETLDKILNIMLSTFDSDDQEWSTTSSNIYCACDDQEDLCDDASHIDTDIDDTINCTTQIYHQTLPIKFDVTINDDDENANCLTQIMTNINNPVHPG